MMDGCHGPSFSEARFSEVLFVWAVLMVIVTFQAGLDPPGGVWQDTGYRNAALFSPNAFESSPPPVHHYAGKSVMSYVDPKRYQYFSLFNDVAFYSSALVIVLLLRGGHSWALKILPNISVLAISVSNVCSLSFSSPYERSVTRSWTFFTRVVLLCTSEILLSIIVLDKFHFQEAVVRFRKKLIRSLIGSLSLLDTTSNTGSRPTYMLQGAVAPVDPGPSSKMRKLQGAVPTVDPGPSSKMHMKIPNPNKNSRFGSKSHRRNGRIYGRVPLEV